MRERERERERERGREREKERRERERERGSCNAHTTNLPPPIKTHAELKITMSPLRW